MFQFQNGAIERQQAARLSVVTGSFNSKMVRLRENLPLFTGNPPSFQFQNGAIESGQRGLCRIALMMFQFQNGAIERTANLVYADRLGRFNSKMVRLRARQHGKVRLTRRRFNSKMVRLRADGRLSGGEFLYRFNSKMVRLRGKANSQPFVLAGVFQFQNGAIERSRADWGERPPTYVSIPKWCD